MVTSLLDSLPAAFARRADLQPGAVALATEAATLTYGELNRRSNRLAHDLLAAGVSRGDLVALALPRGLQAVVAMLAVLKSGAGYLPVDDDSPPARVRQMLDEARVRFALGDPARVAEWRAEGLRAIDPRDTDSGNDHAPCIPIHPLDTAYCMFSSGSTGRPKGIVTTHQGVLNLVTAAEFAALDDRQVVLHAAPLAFDASTFEIWGALLNGGRVAILTEATSVDSIMAIVRQQGVTTAWMTAALFHRACRAGLGGLSGLRQLLAGGDVLQPAAIMQAQRDLPGCRLVNGYGPTETTTFAACHTIPVGFDGPVVPLGLPIQGVRVHILDRAGREVPPGEAGEICIAGAGLAIGYLNNPALTAERFVPDPFGPAGARMYRSGDLGRRLPDGRIGFLGRMDAQVKVNGFRIEPGEIEVALGHLPGLREAAVLARTTTAGESQLIAYVVPEGGADRIDMPAWKEALGQRLPRYMMPARWIALDALPLNANGKVDRAALPNPASERPQTGVDYVAPEGELEAALSVVWGDVLGIDRVGRDDGFATLGGSSIQAIDVAFRVGRAYFGGGRSPAPHGNLTLAEFARCVAQHRGRSEGELAPLADGQLPWASYAQQQVWFLEQMGDGWRAYRFHARLRLRGSLDLDALRSAIQALVDRHEIFRTAFTVHDSRLVRTVLPKVEIDLPIRDVQGSTPAERELDAAACIEQELSHRFDTSRAPLARWILLRLAPQEHWLVQSEHHHLHDGQSFRIVVADLGELYSAAHGGRSATLPPVQAQYGEFCVAERRWLETSDFRDQLRAWSAHLNDAALDARLFADRAGTGGDQDFIGAQERRVLPNDLLQRVDETAARVGVSRFALLMSVFAVLCARHGSLERFAIGTALANRSTAAYRHTVGMFVNMLPVPMDCTGTRRFTDLVQSVGRDIAFTLAHGEVPLGEIVRSLGLTSKFQGDAPFNVGFSCHDSLPARPAFEGLEVIVDEALPNGSSKFDLDVVVITGNEQHGGSVEVVFEYATATFDAGEMAAMLACYERLLDEVCRHPHRRLADLHVLTHEQQAALLATQSPVRAWDTDADLASLFEDRARRTPLATAVEDGPIRLSYAELDRRANQVANALRDRGARAESAVLVWLERGADLVIALLATAKVGAMYVPIDVDYPAQRVREVIALSGGTVLITHASLVSALPEGAPSPLLLDDLRDRCAAPVPRQVTASQLAYSIFTSGSTGRPKGVGVSMRALVNHARSHIEACALTHADRVLQLCSPGFDASIEEIVPTLLAGATLVVGPSRQALEQTDLLQWLHRHEVTVIDLPTSYWSALVAHANPDFGHRFPPTVRLVVIGGEAARRDTVDQLARHRLAPAFRLVNTYGPTETTIVATHEDIRLDAPREPAVLLPLGTAIANCRIYVLDRYGNLVPPGVTGEIHIAGDGVARGYLGQPALTADRFVPDPFGPAGSRMYRSGDLGRYLPDGRLDFCGRADRQLKWRGYRIEPGEIESSIMACTGATQAAVWVHQHEGEQPALVACAVPQAGIAWEPIEATARLRALLPEYMVPQFMITVDRLPLNAHGKLDERSLSALTATAMRERTGVTTEVPPCEPGGDEALSAIMGILRDLLPGAAIGASDDMLSHGMHSALLLRLVTRCGERLGVQPRLRDVFRLTTPAALARHVQELRSAA